MRLIPNDDEQVLARVAHEVLSKECDAEAVRAAWESPTGRSDELWGTLAELGLPGLLAPESMGGLGLGFTAAVVLLEEAGRFLVPEPLMEALIATHVLKHYGTDTQKQRWLPAIASGDVRVAVKASQERLVRDAHIAELVVWCDDDSVGLVRSQGLDLKEVPLMDRSRRAFRVTLAAQDIEPLGAEKELVSTLGATATAAMLVGLSAGLLDRTVKYVGMREQFGRRIGSFQAVKHGLADAHVLIETARQAVWAAAGSLREPTSDSDTSPQVSASVAKIQANRAARVANDVALQFHGGIGFTWEHDLHLWLKRGKALEAQFGTTRWHQRRLSRHLVKEWGEKTLGNSV